MTKVFKAFGIEFTLDDEVDEPSPMTPIMICPWDG